MARPDSRLRGNDVGMWGNDVGVLREWRGCVAGMTWVCCGLGARAAAQAARVQIPAFAGMTMVYVGE